MDSKRFGRPVKRLDQQGSAANPTEPDFLVIGRITRPHGVRGEVGVAVYTDTPERFEWLTEVYVSSDVDDSDPVLAQVEHVRYHRELVLLKLVDYPDRTAAEALRGLWVLVPRAAAVPLEEGEYYLYQLMGLTVVTTQGETLGQLVDILETGANHVFVVQGDRGELLLPDIPEVVQVIDFTTHLMTIQLLPGLLPE